MAKMPWGKFQGFFIKDIPQSYLEWCIKTFDDKAMAGFLVDEYSRRKRKKQL
jgi:uncharacterized protein (DUF3820 family)